MAAAAKHSLHSLKTPGRRQHRPFRRSVLRGLGIITPPVLTIVIFLWVGSTLQRYVLQPVTSGTRDVLAWAIADIQTRDEVPSEAVDKYNRLPDKTYVPREVYEQVENHPDTATMPRTGFDVYRRWVEIRYLQPRIVVPLFTILFIIAMYLLGRFLAAGIGRVMWNLVERGIHRLPLVRNVYSSVKQVTDFVFNESEIEYTRVVAVEYPRRGIWSIGLATGEGMLDLRVAANEPVVSVLIPSSPMPVTGYTITLPKSQTIDLDITIDQAFQYIVSCGVVVAPHQNPSLFKGQATSSRPKALPTGGRVSDSPEVSASNAASGE